MQERRRRGTSALALCPGPRVATCRDASPLRPSLARKGERAKSDNPVRVGLGSETGFPHCSTPNASASHWDRPGDAQGIQVTERMIVYVVLRFLAASCAALAASIP